MNINENSLQKEVINKLKKIGWSEVDYNNARNNKQDVILTNTLKTQLSTLNKNRSEHVIQDAFNQILFVSNSTLAKTNKKFHSLLVNGIEVNDKTAKINKKLKLIDFENIERNRFEFFEEFEVLNLGHTKRIDIQLFVNGIPLVTIELKSPIKKTTSIHDAFLQIKTYQERLDNLFKYNLFNVISDGHNAKFGTLTSTFERYQLWKKKDIKSSIAKKEEPLIDFLVEGLLNHKTFFDVIQNYVVFTTKDEKIIAGYHQYYGMKKAITSIKESNNGKAGIIWHTQGSGKSYSMVFLSRLIIKSSMLKNPTILVITDRIDLNTQLFQTFSKSSNFLKEKPKIVDSKKSLIKELKNIQVGGIYFTTVQKFEEATGLLSTRKNIITIVDEAHRSHDETKIIHQIDKVKEQIKRKYSYSESIRKALPNAILIGFTGTPIDTEERQTKQTFGPVIDVYDMKQSVDDGATVPIKYEMILPKMGTLDEGLKTLNKTLDNMKQHYDNELVEEAEKQALSLGLIIGDKDRLNIVSDKFLKHYNNRRDQLNGKAMFVAYNREIAFKMYKLIIQKDSYLKDKTKLIVTSFENKDSKIPGMLQAIGDKASQNEIIKQFKDESSNVKVLIVVDMLLTGYDVPSLDVLYIDKPLRMHSLMQAIARVNRVYPGKDSGLIVDFIGLGKYLKEAIAKYTTCWDNVQLSIEDIEVVIKKIKDIVESIRALIHGYDFKLLQNPNSKNMYQYVVEIYSKLKSDGDLSKDSKWKRFKALAKKLYSGYKIAINSIKEETLKHEICTYIAVWAFGRKSEYKPTLNPELFEALKKQLTNLVESTIISKQIITIEDFISGSELDLLTDTNIERLKKEYSTPTLNEILKNWVTKEIKFLETKNIVRSKDFEERLKTLLDNYNKVSDPEGMLLQLTNLAKDIKQYDDEGNKLGLEPNELAFYDILRRPEKVREEFDNPTLIKIAKELLEVIGKNKTIDWYKRDDAKAKMRVEVKKLLRKYNYPPKEVIDARDNIIRQTENYIEHNE